MNQTERAARALVDAINDRDLERIRDLVTDDFVDHGAPPGLVPPGPDGYITVMEFVTGVLQLRYEIHEVVVADDRVALRATGHGVHRSDHLGVPATGRPYAMPSMHLYRGDGDRLAEHWGVRDELSVLYQVGALTPGPLPSLAFE
ncbi:MAG: ester cyclase [Acidimicrobiales bacterium]|jgi:predicted ester cyclase